MRSRQVDGPEIRRTREARGLSVPAFARLLSKDLGRPVSVSMLCKVEKAATEPSSREPSAELFAAIKRVLKVKGREALLLAENERGAA